MTSHSLQAYSKIYDIASENIAKAGKKMVFTKETFLYSTKQELKYIDLFDMTRYDNESFLQILYLALFFRTPEENARNNWGKLFHLPQKDFQEKCFSSLSSSEEYFRNGTIFFNNIYSTPIININTTVIQTSESNPYIDKLYGFYYRLPAGVKTMIKRLLQRKSR